MEWCPPLTYEHVTRYHTFTYRYNITVLQNNSFPASPSPHFSPNRLPADFLPFLVLPPDFLLAHLHWEHAARPGLDPATLQLGKHYKYIFLKSTHPSQKVDENSASLHLWWMGTILDFRWAELGCYGNVAYKKTWQGRVKASLRGELRVWMQRR